MKIKKYKQKCDIEAVRITTKNIHDVKDWCGGEINNIADVSAKWAITIEIGFLETFTGIIGDWVVKNSNERFFIVDNEFFKQSFKEIK